MEAFHAQLKSCKSRTPTEKDVEILALQLEQMSLAGKPVKNLAMEAIRELRGTPVEFNDHILRLYQIVSRISTTMGATGIYEHVEGLGGFQKSLKFHLLWAESYAQKNQIQKFREVVEIARRRMPEVDPGKFEAGFRDIADIYLCNSDNLFATKEITKHDAKKQGRRRSSIAALHQMALPKSTVPSSALAAPKGLRVRFEMIDRDNEDYFGISPEEWLAAQFADQADVDDDRMDITTGEEEPKVYQPSRMSLSTAGRPLMRLPRDSLIPVNGDKGTIPTFAKTDDLDILEEETSDPKRRRILSPMQPVAPRVPRRNIEKLPEKPSKESAPFIEEHDFQKAAAIFSDTVCIGPAEDALTTRSTTSDVVFTDDPTLPIQPKPVKSFEVFVDQPAEFAVPSVPPEKENRRKGLVEMETRTKPEEPVDFGIADEDLLDISAIPKPSRAPNARPFMFDDTLIKGNIGSGSRRASGIGIVTSTPFTVSRSTKPTEEEFLASYDKIEPDGEADTEENAFEGMGFMRGRKSISSKSISGKSIDSKMSSMKLGNEEEEEQEENMDINDMNATGINPPKTSIEIGTTNPWSPELRCTLMADMETPSELHIYQIQCPKISKRSNIVLCGQTYRVDGLLGEGGYAKVFKAYCDDNTSVPVAIKYEVPSCAWEVYICDQVRSRLQQNDSVDARRCMESVMQVTDGYVYNNASLILNDYLQYGTLLELASRLSDPHSQLILLIGIKMAQILKEVHRTQIIHGDAKPDNFMILRRLPETASVDQLIDLPVLKLIDWGRAIDMKHLDGQTFFGRAGTANFDCPEMMDGRPWNYHTDIFAFVASLHVFIFGAYCEFEKSDSGFKMNKNMKRRLVCREVLEPIFTRFLNIPVHGPLPDWEEALQAMIAVFRSEFKQSEWRSIAAKFNESLPDNK